jgi:hypothetical protein
VDERYLRHSTNKCNEEASLSTAIDELLVKRHIGAIMNNHR